MKIFSDLTEEEKKTLTYWGLFGIIAFMLVILFSFLYVENKKNNTGKDADKGYSIVYDQNHYYTVIGAVDKYYQFINMSDAKALMKILDTNYVKDKKIKESNVLDIVKNSEIMLAFDPGVMCKKDNGKGQISYLIRVKEKPYFTVSGDDETIIEDKSLSNMYYRVMMDHKELSYSITLISEKEYGDACYE